jgi:ATP-binding cassette subfamily B protein
VFNHELSKPLVDAVGASGPYDLLDPITALFCFTVLVAAVVRALTLWLRTRITFAIGSDLSTEIYRRTLYQPYSVHLTRNSSEVVDGISGKVNTVIGGVVSPALIILSNTLMLILIFSALLFFEPLATLASFGGFGLIYWLIHQSARSRLKSNSRQIAQASTRLIRLVQEGLGGIRDVLLNSLQSTYCVDYKMTDGSLRQAQSKNTFISELPRLAIESSGICIIAALALYLAHSPEGFKGALPILGAVAIAAQRLLPLLQQIYQGFSNMSGSDQSLLDTLRFLEQPLSEEFRNNEYPPIEFEKAISFRQVGFRYSSDGPWILRDLDLEIPKGRRVGLIGSTASGKSTFLDIFMALLHPSEGSLYIDGREITTANCSGWRDRISHVPQSIYLTDATIAENIAFGVPRDRIDMLRVSNAAKSAYIADEIEKMPYGYNSVVGERGVRLSGGQRQRIGLARALYREADVLVLDEATSALDNATELEVMRAIGEVDPNLTIIIVAHRLSSLSQCDFVIELGNEKILRMGTYASLIGAREKLNQVMK